MTDQSSAAVSTQGPMGLLPYAIAAFVVISAGVYAMSKAGSASAIEAGDSFSRAYQAEPESFSVTSLSADDLAKIDPAAVSGLHLKKGISLSGRVYGLACTTGSEGAISTFMIVHGVVAEAESNADYTKRIVEAGICEKVVAEKAS